MDLSHLPDAGQLAAASSALPVLADALRPAGSDRWRLLASDFGTLAAAQEHAASYPGRRDGELRIARRAVLGPTGNPCGGVVIVR